MLREALAFPTRGDRGAVSVLAGGVLVFLRWLFLTGTAVFGSLAVAADGAGSAAAVGVLATIVVLLVPVELALRGYRIRALRATVADPDADAPGFGRLSALFRDGLLGAGVTVAYTLPGVVLLAVAAAGVGAVPPATPAPASLADAVARNLAGLSLLFGLLALVGAAYLLPAAAASAAHDRAFRSAFRRRVVAGALSEDYAVGWLTAGVLGILVFPLVLAVSALAILPLVAAPFGSFFVAVASRHLYGAGFGAATGLAARDAVDSAPEASPDRKSGTARSGTDDRGAVGQRAGGGTATEPTERGSADRSTAEESVDDAPGSPRDPMAEEFRR